MRDSRLYFMFTSYCMVMTLHLHSSLLTLRNELRENHTSSQIPLRSAMRCRDISWEATDHWWRETIADTLNYSYCCFIILVDMGSPQLSRRVVRHDLLLENIRLSSCSICIFRMHVAQVLCLFRLITCLASRHMFHFSAPRRE